MVPLGVENDLYAVMVLFKLKLSCFWDYNINEQFV